MSNSIRQIRAAFRQAAKPKPHSEAGTRLSTRELQRAVRAATKDGVFTPAEKRAVVQGYASFYNGNSFEATQGAEREYMRVMDKYRLPMPESL